MITPYPLQKESLTIYKISFLTAILKTLSLCYISANFSPFNNYGTSQNDEFSR